MAPKNKKNKNKNVSTSSMAAPSATRVYGDDTNAITDSRFIQSQKDPRFQEVPKHKNKVKIDSRFKRMLTDKHFTSSSSRVDKRGRVKKNDDSSVNNLKEYYRIENDSELAKNEGNEGEDEDEGGYLEMEEDGLQIEEENVPEIDKETHRLAVVNLDWSQVQAVDLFVVLNSFLPKTGQILSVSVYPSEFGLKRMEEEAVKGPVGLFDDENGKNTKDDSDESDDDEEIDNEKLRAYELSRLRYYFAVVVCDSVATADYLYKSCDGIEFERSSNKLDLRFIPDSMEFKHPARDVATEAPANYEGIDFQTRALQQSKIDLTWDENEPQRSKKLDKINADEESEYVKYENELKDFIASSDSESDEDDSDGNKPGKRQKNDRYRALLQSGDGSDDNEDDEGMDMEVTFNTGLEDLSNKILEKKKDKNSETVWDAYLRKKKEKKKARKNKSKDSSDDESDDSDGDTIEEAGDFFAGDTTQKKKASRDKKAQKSETGLSKEEAEASRAELELLLADDDGGDANVKGYNLKRKKAKGKKGKQDDIDEEKIPTVDYEDPRFSSLYTRPEYALDPTDPQFKRSAAYVRQVAHKQNKDDVAEKGGQPNDSPVEAQAAEPKKSNSKKDHETSMLIKSIKMKSQQLTSDAKKSRRNAK
ncbi:NUC153-like protein [Artemisia annua]|uniref:NUC153-like protein n=1 Tax=Artemisia annua TaxID=35608 RepID=A0A2U1P230_ARTAN|nr:NUC153-like protein [Artemisia annua]